jgi:hypothetical protein
MCHKEYIFHFIDHYNQKCTVIMVLVHVKHDRTWEYDDDKFEKHREWALKHMELEHRLKLTIVKMIISEYGTKLGIKPKRTAQIEEMTGGFHRMVSPYKFCSMVKKIATKNVNVSPDDERVILRNIWSSCKYIFKLSVGEKPSDWKKILDYRKEKHKHIACIQNFDSNNPTFKMIFDYKIPMDCTESSINITGSDTTASMPLVELPLVPLTEQQGGKHKRPSYEMSEISTRTETEPYTESIGTDTISDFRTPSPEHRHGRHRYSHRRS